MLEIILIVTIVCGWTVAIIWAYWGNGGMKDFKKSLKKILDRMTRM